MGLRGGFGPLVQLTLAIVLYGLFWAALALWVNSLGRNSSFNTVALVMAWVALLLVAPAALNATAQVLHPTPPRSEMAPCDPVELLARPPCGTATLWLFDNAQPHSRLCRPIQSRLGMLTFRCVL